MYLVLWLHETSGFHIWNTCWALIKEMKGLEEKTMQIENTTVFSDANYEYTTCPVGSAWCLTKTSFTMFMIFLKKISKVMETKAKLNSLYF